MARKLQQISFEFMPGEEMKESAIEVNEPAISGDDSSAGAGSTDNNKDESTKVIEQLVKKRLSKRGRPSLKEMDLTSDLVEVPADEILFQKQYYPIGVVAKWFKVNQSLLRYWETEFDILEPRKNRKGDRFFRPVDIKNLLLIHDLLRRRKFTIEGAKEYLKKNRKAEEKFAMIQSLEKIKAFFLQLRSSL